MGLLQTMGCCCCKNSEEEDYQSFNEKGSESPTPNCGSHDEDADSLVNSASQTKNPPQQLITNSTKESWNINETERLEHELEKEIIIQTYKHSSDKTILVAEVDDVLEDSLEQSSISDQREPSKTPDGAIDDG